MAKTSTSNQALLSGNEALAYGAYEAGLSVACAYPGTPSTEILETLAQFPDVDAQWSVNEKVAFEVALGAAIAGARSLFACKHVGLNVAMDPLMTASYTGILAGFVVVVADDPGMHSSQNEQDTRWVALYSKLPMLEPASPAEAKEFIQEAFKISERYDTPVLLRMTTRVSHTKENVVLKERQVPPRPEFERNIAKYVMVPGNAYQRHILVEKRLQQLQSLSEKSRFNRIEKGDGKLGFVTSGVAYQYVKENYPDASYLKLGMTYPFCDDKIKAFAKTVKKVVVVEELDPFIEEHVKALGVKVAAKDRSFRIGELSPELIPALVAGQVKQEVKVVKRKPRLCPECPHWATFAALKKLDLVRRRRHRLLHAGLPAAHVGPAFLRVHGCRRDVQRGLAQGAPGKKIVGVLGDSTFVHSGITGLINAAYNKAKGVILILDNSTTAMTGGQQHPATGLTIRNEPTKKLILEDICRACGVDHVDVVDPKNLEEFRTILEKRVNEDALSVIISRHPCKLLRR